MQCHICKVVVFSFILIKYNLCIYVLCTINKLFGYPSCQWGITDNELLRNVRRVTRIFTCISPSHHAFHNLEVLWDQDDKPGLCICHWNICLPVVVDNLLAHCQCLQSLCHHHRWSWIKLHIKNWSFGEVEERCIYFTAKHATMDDWRRENMPYFYECVLGLLHCWKCPHMHAHTHTHTHTHTHIRNTEYIHDWKEDQNAGDWLNHSVMFSSNYLSGNSNQKLKWIDVHAAYLEVLNMQFCLTVTH